MDDESVQPLVPTADVRCSYPAIPAISPLGGAQSWAKQVWPYGKTTPVYASAGGMRDAFGDLTRPPGTLRERVSAELLEQMNAERAVLCMPLLTLE